MKHRTNNHVTRIRCKDVAASYARRRAALVEMAATEGATVLHNNAHYFHAERVSSSNERVTYMACEQGAPYVNGPCIIHRMGAVEYVDLLLPKVTK